MKILVCLKQILDPELPPKDFKLDPGTRQLVKGAAKWVMDSYAENALEVALQLKEQVSGSAVTAISVADKPVEEVLRRAYAMTADMAVRAWEPGWTDLDAAGVAHVLARIVHKAGGADLILLGRQAGDIEQGAVGPMLAEELGLPCVTCVSKVVPAGNGQVRLWREVEGGVNVIEASLPLVVTVTNDDGNVPRLPKVKDLMMASRKPVTAYGAASDLDVDPAALEARSELREVYIPVQNGSCEMVDGEDGTVKAQNLTVRLKAMKVV